MAEYFQYWHKYRDSEDVPDMDIPAELHRLYGHVLCGIYVQVDEGGTVREGDAAVAA